MIVLKTMSDLEILVTLHFEITNDFKTYQKMLAAKGNTKADIEYLTGCFEKAKARLQEIDALLEL